MSSNGAFSRQARSFFNDAKQHVQDEGRTHMGISFRGTVTSFTAQYWGTLAIQLFSHPARSSVQVRNPR